MTTDDPSLSVYLKWLRLVDPDGAGRLQSLVRARREEAVHAEFAFQDLSEAARRAVLDLTWAKSGREHVLAAVKQRPIDGWSSDVRSAVALEYLARAADPPAFEISGQSPDEFLFHSYLTATAQDEVLHMDTLATIRSAMRLARAASLDNI